MAGTIMQATKRPLTTWFLALYPIGQAKTGIYSLDLRCHLGVMVDTVLLLQNKILRAMADREEPFLLQGKIQIDDSFFGGNSRAEWQVGERSTGSPSTGPCP